MDWAPMVKREGFACLATAGVTLLAFLPFVVAAGEGQIDAPDVAVRSSFFYWMLDSFMWAVALYYILTRRAAFIELFQRFMLRQDELTAQIDEIELKATELADEYEEIAKHLPNIRGTRHSAKLIGILTAVDAATRRMLDSLPLPSSPAKKDDGGGDSSLSVSREDGEPDAVAPHDVVPQVASSDEGEDSSPAMPAAPAAKPIAEGAAVEAQEGSGEEDQRAPTKAEDAKEPPVKTAEEKDDNNNDDQGGESPIEDSASEKSDLGYTPDSRKTPSVSTNPLPGEDEQEQQSEDDEERPNGSSPGAANAPGASAARRKRRLRSRRSIKCRAGEYDDTVGEVDLMRSGSEPDSDASEHRSSDTSVGLGEPLDPSSQFVNEDMRMGGSPSRPHHRKKKEKKPKTRNLKRSSKKMGRSKEVLQSVFTEESERRGANRDESYSEGGDGEGEDQRDKLLRELSQAEAESANGQGRVDLDALKAELEGASLSEDDKLVDERMETMVEEEEEDVSDSWRNQKDSSSDESSDGEAEDKSDFMKLVEEGNDDDNDDDEPGRSRSSSRSSSRSQSRSPSRSRSRSPSGSDDEQLSALDSLKAQLDGLDFGDDPVPRPLRSESFTSLQNQLKGLDDLGSFGQLDSLAASAGGESEEDEVEQRARRLDQRDDDSSSEEEQKKEEKQKKDEGNKRATGLGASPLSSKSSTLKRRSILDVFDNNYEGPGEGQAAQRQQPPAPPVERGDRAVRDIAAREDINVSGLRRAKKTPTTFGSMNRGTKKSIRPQYDMEDAHTVVHPFFEDEGSAFIAVLDGHAGMAVAQEGVKLFPQKLKAHLDAGKPSDHNLEDVLKQTFASVDAELTEHEFVGATATAVFVWTEEGKRYLQAANVGDSAAFLRRGNQTVKLTYDHKVTDEGERERLVGMGVELSTGATRINGLAVSRALGDHFMKENGLGLISEPYVCQPIELTDEDSILIVASDGLWDVMPGEEAMQIVEGMDSVEDMASCLVRSAVASSLCADNVTVVVARL